jgi:gluconolactonase
MFRVMAELTEITSGLRFPEGPIAMDDGSVVLVEIEAERLTRVLPDGTKETIADVPGGPNGAAVGPDGAFYLCNNGGGAVHVERRGLLIPGGRDPARYLGGKIQRVDPTTGAVTDLYLECDGRPLRAPNDLVFDRDGGFWFTDHGIREDRKADVCSIYYGRADGSSVREVVHPTDAPNGIGLSPDGGTVYWAETYTGRVLRRTVTGPGEVERAGTYSPAAFLAGLPGLQLLDSLAVDGDGNVCVATILNGGVTVISPDGEILEHIPTGDPYTTNVCFGGPDRRTAYITLSGTGRLVSTPWPCPGLALAF